MPAKRVILLDRSSTGSMQYRAALWADVPAANQIARKDPNAKSNYKNISPAELQTIRDGLVAEKLVTYQANDLNAVTMPAVQTDLTNQWTAWQAEVTAVNVWSDYGMYWDGVAWNASPGIPMFSAVDNSSELPAFVALTPVSAFGANKFHFVLYNGAPTATSQGLVVKVRLIAILPGIPVVTGVASSPWTLSRRLGVTTPPSGAGSFSPVQMDSGQALVSGVSCFNAPAVSPSGGALSLFSEFIPQPDEIKVTTADAPTLAPLMSSWAGQVIYCANDVAPARPLTVRPGETIEIQQGATAGTGNCRVLCVFTVG